MSQCRTCKGTRKIQRHMPGHVHYETDAGEPCPFYHYSFVPCPDCAEVERRIAEAVAAREAELMIARKLLWLRHGCPVSALYGDDGEMQCGRCNIDFKRSPIQDIEARFQRMNFEQMKAEQVAATIRARADPSRAAGHDYTSTACQHSLHDRCRKECKFCGVKCRCDCHTKEKP